MTRVPLVLTAAGALIAGTAFAESPKTHVMNVSLPDGSVAQVQYVGDIAPKVTIAPPTNALSDGSWGMRLPSFAGFDRMMAQMKQQSQAIARQAQAMARQAQAEPYQASLANLPAGETSTTVVSFSNNGVSCTRTTEIVSQGPGKPPKVTSNATGKCGNPVAPTGRGSANPA